MNLPSHQSSTFKQKYELLMIVLFQFGIKNDCLHSAWLLNTNDQAAFDDKIYCFYE